MNKSLGDSNWPRNFAALLRYGEEYKTCNVPSKAVYECILPGMGDNGTDFQYMGRLGVWLNNQRRAKKGTHGSRRITPDREALLQMLVDEGEAICVGVFDIVHIGCVYHVC
jgi:hypothetical protein